MELNPQLTKEKFENHLRDLIDKVKNLNVEMNEEEYQDLVNEVYIILNFHSLHRVVSMDNTKKILKDSYDKTINEMTDNNQLMFIDDVMKDFGISRSTLRRWNNLGLKKIKVKRKVYYMRNDIMTFIKNLND